MPRYIEPVIMVLLALFHFVSFDIFVLEGNSLVALVNFLGCIFWLFMAVRAYLVQELCYTKD